MGYSYSEKAGKTLDQMEALARRQTGSQNVLVVGADRYFFEVDTHHEDSDGTIKGDVYRLYEGGMAEHYRTFRIDGGGKLTGPHWLKRLLREVEVA